MNLMGLQDGETMAEIKFQLESLAYLAGSAMSVADRRRLDELLRWTETHVDSDSEIEPAGAEQHEVVVA
jgi:hypothetical protein